MKTKNESAKERVAAFLKKAGKRRYSATHVGKELGYCAEYVRTLDCWKENRKQFIKPTVEERVQKYLSTVGKTIPPLKKVADACKCDVSSVYGTSSWKTHVKKHKPLPLNEQVQHFLTAVWDEPEKYTARQVAEQCGCHISRVETLDIWKEYQKHWASGSAEERITRLLSKDKTGKRKYTRREVADELGLHVTTITNSPAMQKYQNGIRQAEGTKQVKYRVRTKKLSPELDKRITAYLSKHKKDKKTSREVAVALDTSRTSVEKSPAWEKHQKQFAKPKTEKLISSLLFDKNGKPKLYKNTGKKYKRREVSIAVRCNESTVTDSESWEKYQRHFACIPVEKRVRSFLFHKNGTPKLAKDKTGKRPFTAREVYIAVGCAEVTVLEKEAWKEYQKKVKTLRPPGMASERIEKALQDLLATHETKPTLGQIAEKADCSKTTVGHSDAWQNRYMLFPKANERIKKALSELLEEEIPSPTKRQVAEKAKCSLCTVQESPDWKHHRQRLSANDSPVESATSPAGSSKPIIAARIGKKKVSADKTTFTKEEYKEYLENTPIVNAPDEMILKGIDSTALEGMKEAVRHGMREGLLDTDALSQPAREAAIRKRQEEMISAQGLSPVEIARIHNPNAGKKKIRNESSRIARHQREKKQND